MSDTKFNININNEGLVEVTHVTTMTTEKFLQWSAQVHNFHLNMNGRPINEIKPAIESDKKT